MRNILIALLTICLMCCGTTKNVSPTNTTQTNKNTIVKTETHPISSIKTDTIFKNIEVDVPKIKLPPKPPKQVELYSFNHNRWHKLLQEFVTKNGNVDYEGIRTNRTDLDIYIDQLSHNLPKENELKENKLAFWINAYNAFTIDLIIRNYPLKSIKDIKDPWKQRLWQIGEKWYNLDEIEHQILRKMEEPRIHFAIVCASFSCPKLQNTAFTPKDLETQLNKATKDFLSDTNRNIILENQIKISKIFKWFSKDFKQNGSLIDFLNLYSSKKINRTASITYMDYNWSLND